MMDAAGNERPYKCKECDADYMKADDLKTHMMRHNDSFPFRCDICDKGFRYSSGLKRHIESHEREYRCRECNEVFPREHQLKEHSYRHTGIWPYTCPICDKIFLVESSLKGHMYLHTGDWPFKCHLCTKGFIQARDLKNHSYVHTGEWPMRCEKCQKGFAIKSQLETHMDRCTGPRPNIEDLEENSNKNNKMSTLENQDSETEEDATDIDDVPSEFMVEPPATTTISVTVPVVTLPPTALQTSTISSGVMPSMINAQQMTLATPLISPQVISTPTTEVLPGTVNVQLAPNEPVLVVNSTSVVPDTVIQYPTSVEPARLVSVMPNVNSQAPGTINHFTGTNHETSICQMCNNKVNVRDLRQFTSNSGEKVIMCDKCLNTSMATMILQRREDKVKEMPEKKPYQCNQCENSYLNADDLKKHSYVHTGNWPLSCQQCGKGFVYDSGLQRHLKSHLNEKKYPCDQCSLCFKRKDDLTDHQFTHAGVIPFQCKVCNKIYGSKQALKGHMYTHTNDWPFRCELCHKGFACASLLKTHTYQHTQEWPYKCKHCKQGYMNEIRMIGHQTTCEERLKIKARQEAADRKRLAAEAKKSIPETTMISSSSEDERIAPKKKSRKDHIKVKLESNKKSKRKQHKPCKKPSKS